MSGTCWWTTKYILPHLQRALPPPQPPPQQQQQHPLFPATPIHQHQTLPTVLVPAALTTLAALSTTRLTTATAATVAATAAATAPQWPPQALNSSPLLCFPPAVKQCSANQAL